MMGRNNLEGSNCGLTEFIFLNLCGGTKDNHEKCLPGLLVPLPVFEPSTSELRVYTVTATLSRSVKNNCFLYQIHKEKWFKLEWLHVGKLEFEHFVGQIVVICVTTPYSLVGS
jgi:hypothetical protein